MFPNVRGNRLGTVIFRQLLERYQEENSGDIETGSPVCDFAASFAKKDIVVRCGFRK